MWRNNHAKKLPLGIKPKDKDRHRDISFINLSGYYVKGTPHANTFDVVAKHEILPGGTGVKFNVETVPPALKEHLEKKQLGCKNTVEELKRGAAAFYGDNSSGGGLWGFQVSKPADIRIEQISDTPDTLVFAGGNGFLVSCVTAFAQHLPLALSPDHIWSVISYAFAKHVDKHAEELRKNFVEHEGKKRLEVNADHMVMGGGDLGLASSPQEWESTIFPDFSAQIKEFIGEKVHSAIASDFSTTTSTARAAHEITLMSAMKNYFSYGMCTLCGIPSITLMGTEQDWLSLRARAEALGNLMMPSFSDLWMPVLLPVLDEFVESYKGNVNHGFWQSMVKLRDTGGGSGSHSYISGWMQILFPYLADGREAVSGLKPWQEMYFSGPDPKNFPSIVSSAPVDWEYYGYTCNLHFNAGITGCTQDPVDGTMAPAIGWYVTHDPPQEPDARLEAVKAEMEALLQGHASEAQARPLKKDSPWYRRICSLHQEQLALEIPARRAPLMRELEEMEKNRPKYSSKDPSKYKEHMNRVSCLREEIKKLQKQVGDNAVLATDDMIKEFIDKQGQK